MLLEQFESYLRTEKNLSENSIQSYLNDITQFLGYVNKNIKEITSQDVRSFIAHLDQLNRKRSTIHRSLCALKTYFQYLIIVENILKESPIQNIKVHAREKTLPKSLPLTDVQKLLSVAEQEGIKSRLILELLYGLGARVSELCSIKIEDIDFVNGYIRLKGKGNKERYNPIHEDCLKLIKEYTQKHSITEGYLFPNRYDQSKPQTRTGVLTMVKRLARKAGIKEELVSPHVFRHSYAQHLLDNGCEMSVVQDLLGHEDISTTRIYARITTTTKKKNFKHFHPLAH